MVLIDAVSMSILDLFLPTKTSSPQSSIKSQQKSSSTSSSFHSYHSDLSIAYKTPKTLSTSINDIFNKTLLFSFYRKKDDEWHELVPLHDGLDVYFDIPTDPQLPCELPHLVDHSCPSNRDVFTDADVPVIPRDLEHITRHAKDYKRIFDVCDHGTQLRMRTHRSTGRKYLATLDMTESWDFD
jgi:hypothetical protein